MSTLDHFLQQEAEAEQINFYPLHGKSLIQQQQIGMHRDIVSIHDLFPPSYSLTDPGQCICCADPKCRVTDI